VRTSRSGCLIALYVVLGLVVLVLVVGSIGAWLFLRSETGQRLVRATREGISLATEAARAPGTQQLREAGCSQAMVLPMRRMTELFESLGADMGDAQEALDRDEIVVMCQMGGGETAAPSCDDVARIFIDAAGEVPETFAVVVQNRSQRGAACDARYTKDGTRIEEPVEQPPAGQPPVEQPAEPVERLTP
jgi:hypothetical protein